MPSGPKKRKAAKKKKEKEAHNNSNSSAPISINNPQVIVGNEDPESQDERESEGSEVVSPASQDHHKDHNHRQPLAEESEKRATGDAERRNGGQGDGEVGKEPKTMHTVERNGISVKRVEPMKEPHDGNERSSSSSSSDDESQAFAKKQEKDHESVSNAISSHDEERKVDAVSEVVPHISGIGNPLEEANSNSDLEPSPAINSDMHVVPLSEVVKPVMESIQVESSEFVEVAEASTENIDKIPPASSEITGVPLGLLSENSEDKLTLNEKLTFVEVTDVCAADTSNNVQNAKESETYECTETQLLVNSAPRLAQRTSWMSCCGLFEVFAGSNR